LPNGKKVLEFEFGGHHTELSTTERPWAPKNAWHEWQKPLHRAFPIMVMGSAGDRRHRAFSQ